MLKLVLFLLCPAILRSLLSFTELIPYVGAFFQAINPIIAFFIFLSIGWYAGGEAKDLTQVRRTLFLAYALVACSLTYIAPYVAGYYTLPLKVARTVAAQKHVELTYREASNSVRTLLRQETGSDGVIAYAIYSQRSQLAGRSFVDYCARQFEEVYDLLDIPIALINIILHAIPFLLKWLLCDKLAWIGIGEASLISLTFWYLFSVTLLYVGYRTV